MNILKYVHFYSNINNNGKKERLIKATRKALR